MRCLLAADKKLYTVFRTNLVNKWINRILKKKSSLSGTIIIGKDKTVY